MSNGDHADTNVNTPEHTDLSQPSQSFQPDIPHEDASHGDSGKAGGAPVHDTTKDVTSFDSDAGAHNDHNDGYFYELHDDMHGDEWVHNDSHSDEYSDSGEPYHNDYHNDTHTDDYHDTHGDSGPVFKPYSQQLETGHSDTPVLHVDDASAAPVQRDQELAGEIPEKIHIDTHGDNHGDAHGDTGEHYDDFHGDYHEDLHDDFDGTTVGPVFIDGLFSDIPNETKGGIDVSILQRFGSFMEQLEQQLTRMVDERLAQFSSETARTLAESQARILQLENQLKDLAKTREQVEG
jgi:hypothetical protein